MNDIHVSRAESAVRPRVSQPVQVAANAGEQASAASASRSDAGVAREAVQGAAAPSPTPRHQQVEQAVAHLNDYVQSVARDIRFHIDNDSGHAVVRVVNRDTDEVIRQIPSELALRLVHNLEQTNELHLFQAQV